MQTEVLAEARRQAEICNACRYCEGLCAVFPALQRERMFADGTLVQLANLCHDCRGCYYACQYTAPHEFNLNLPLALSEVRRGSWEDYAWPRFLGRAFHQSGVALGVVTAVGIAALFFAARALGGGDGDGFYAVLSHGVMVGIFLPAFLFPLLSLAVSLRRYWRDTGGGTLRLSHVVSAFSAAARMKNLAGGHGEGCNYEDEDRYTQSRRVAHHAVMYGFLLCFASTVSGTVLHYVFDMPAPYGFWSVPKLFGVPGGLMMVVGTMALAWLKLKADRDLGQASAWGGEMGFVLLLFLVAATGLVLYALGGTPWMPALLAIHLGAVLAFFLLTPYSKMAHGFYRLTALAKEAVDASRARL